MHRVGIDNYGLYPLALSPLETLEWASQHGASGVAFSGLSAGDLRLINQDYLRELRTRAEELGLYVEWGGGQHIPRDLSSWSAKDIFSVNQRAAAEAETLGTRIVRSCSGGLMRWQPSSPPTEMLLAETAASLLKQREMLRGHGVILALETHFEFTTHELVQLFEMCEAEPQDWLGICLDTMNLLIMLEDPLTATRRVLPWVVSTHIKDGAIILDEEGFRVFTTPIGKGSVNLESILGILHSVNRPLNLNVEAHGGDFLIPVFSPLFLSRFPDISAGELARLVERAMVGLKSFNQGEIFIQPREEWGQVCEKRLAQDLEAFNEIARASRAHLNQQ